MGVPAFFSVAKLKFQKSLSLLLFLCYKFFKESDKSMNSRGFFFPNQISKGNWRFNFLRINEADFGFATFLYNIYRQIGYPLIGTN